MTDDSPPRPDRPEEPNAEPSLASEEDDAADVSPPSDEEHDATEGVRDADDENDGDDDRLRRYVERAILAVLFLFAVVVAFRFYFAASNAVSQWVAGPYQSLFQAAFNLVVLLVVAAGIARQVRRMR